jgi:ABC-type Co2+ transport system permease subunit
VFTWALALLYSSALLFENYAGAVSALDTSLANRLTFHPLTLVLALVLACLGAWAERRLENGPEFPTGLLIGELTVLATTFLDSLVLVWGGREDWPSLVLLVLLPHIVIALIEGVVLGFTLSFLARVKPEMLGDKPGRGARDEGREEKTACVTEPVP